MVDVPDYLLERSRDAYFKEKGKHRSDDAEGAPAEPAKAAEAEAPAAEEAPPEPEAAPEPEPAEVEAEVPAAATASAGTDLELPPAAPPAPPEPPVIYAPPAQIPGGRPSGRGAKVPGWMIPVYLLTPLLAIALAVAFINLAEETEGAQAAGPDGAALYAENCAACHGPGGEGGVGPALADLPTVFANPEEAVAWVDNVAASADGPYGDGGSGNNGEGARTGAMPAFEGQLSPEEVQAVVVHEYVEFGGADSAEISGALGIEAAAGAEGGEGGAGEPSTGADTGQTDDPNLQESTDAESGETP